MNGKIMRNKDIQSNTDRQRKGEFPADYLTNDTLVDILCTRVALVPRGAVTIELAIDRVRVALSSHLTRVAGAGIINVTKQTLIMEIITMVTTTDLKYFSVLLQ